MKNVIIYTRMLCGFCDAAKRLFRDKNIEFEEIDATWSPEIREEMIKKSGRDTFPQIFINEHHIGGCDDLIALEREGKLDDLLG